MKTKAQDLRERLIAYAHQGDAFSSIVGCSPPAIRDWASGSRVPTAPWIPKLAAAFGCEPARVVAEIVEPILEERGKVLTPLAGLRMATGLNVRQFAEAHGFRWSSYQRWEVGRAMPTEEERQRLAAALGMPVDQFVRLSGIGSRGRPAGRKPALCPDLVMDVGSDCIDFYKCSWGGPDATVVQLFFKEGTSKAMALDAINAAKRLVAQRWPELVAVERSHTGIERRERRVVTPRGSVQLIPDRVVSQLKAATLGEPLGKLANALCNVAQGNEPVPANGVAHETHA